MQVFMYIHDKWSLTYETILSNCICIVTFQLATVCCSRDGLLLALRAISVQQKATLQVVHQSIGFRCEWLTKTLGFCGCWDKPLSVVEFIFA